MMKLQIDVAAESPFELYMALAEVTRQLRQGMREDAGMICDGKAEYDFWLLHCVNIWLSFCPIRVWSKFPA